MMRPHSRLLNERVYCATNKYNWFFSEPTHWFSSAFCHQECGVSYVNCTANKYNWFFSEPTHWFSSAFCHQECGVSYVNCAASKYNWFFSEPTHAMVLQCILSSRMWSELCQLYSQQIQLVLFRTNPMVLQCILSQLRDICLIFARCLLTEHPQDQIIQHTVCYGIGQVKLSPT